MSDFSRDQWLLEPHPFIAVNALSRVSISGAKIAQDMAASQGYPIPVAIFYEDARFGDGDRGGSWADHEEEKARLMKFMRREVKKYDEKYQ
jgi:hypothetical protein